MWKKGEQLHKARENRNQSEIKIYVRPEPLTAQYYKGGLNFLDDTLEKLQDKASMIAKAMGKSGYEITDLNVDGASPVVPMYNKTMMMRAEAGMAADMAAPVAEAGETDVSLSVSARVLLKP